MELELVQLSRTMSYALRHHPEQFGLKLDDEGWVTVEALLRALREHKREWRGLREEDFAAVIAGSEKRRFEMRDGKIRAYYGHSIEQRMKHTPAVPPAILYHGTTPEAARSIRSAGLKPMKRQYVHLSSEVETARQVALRRTRHPVVLKVQAEQAYQRGITFYLSNDNVWLADSIAAEFIQFP